MGENKIVSLCVQRGKLGSRRDSPFFVESFTELIHERVDAVEPHPLALLVEVKVHILCLWLVKDNERVLKRLLDRPLVLDLVDEVDEVYLAVERDLLRQVGAESRRLGEVRDRISASPRYLSATWTDGFWQVHDLQVGRIAQIVDLRPEDGRAPSDLHKAEPLPALNV